MRSAPLAVVSVCDATCGRGSGGSMPHSSHTPTVRRKLSIVQTICGRQRDRDARAHNGGNLARTLRESIRAVGPRARADWATHGTNERDGAQGNIPIEVLTGPERAVSASIDYMRPKAPWP